MARDIYHNAVRRALEKENWLVTADPLVLKLPDARIEIDMAAEQVFAAEKDNTLIAVEVKSFLNKSKLYDFYEANGQYRFYRRNLNKVDSERQLFLAVEETIYNTFFQKSIIVEALEEDKISLIIFNSQTETIVKWIIN